MISQFNKLITQGTQNLGKINAAFKLIRNKQSQSLIRYYLKIFYEYDTSAAWSEWVSDESRDGL